MNKEALYYNKHGLQLLNAQKLDEAIEFFTKAIELDPDYPDPYHNRGEILLMQNRIIEGNTDIHKAKELRSGRLKKKKQKKKKKVRCNWDEIDSVYDKIFPEDVENSSDEESVNFDSEIYDYVFSDDNIETDSLWNGLIGGESDAPGCPAVLEFLGGEREEVSCAVLFHPTPDELSILHLDDGSQDRVIRLAELSCIRLAHLPSFIKFDDTSQCQIEIIQTIDGNIFHEFLDPDQVHEKGIFGFSTKEDTYLPYSFFPRNSIKTRYQDRYLGDILLEKRFISNDALKTALDEHQALREMPLGKIIAKQDNLLYSTIETTLEKAQNDKRKQNLKVGEILVDAGLVDEEQIFDALAFQERMKSKKLGEYLIEKGILREKELYISLAEKYRIPFIDLRQQKVSKKVLTMLPREIVLKYTVMPIGLRDSTLIVASPYPDVSDIRDELGSHARTENVEFVLAQPTHLRNVISILYKDRRAPKKDKS